MRLALTLRVLALLAVAGCGPADPPAAPAPSPLAAACGQRDVTAELALQDEVPAAVESGRLRALLRLTNSSGRPCAMTGPARLAVLGGEYDAQPLPSRTVPLPGKPGRHQLAPGSSLYAGVSFRVPRNTGARCAVLYPKVAVYPPGAERAVLAPVRLAAGKPNGDPLGQVCALLLGSLSPSPDGVVAVVAGSPW